MCVPVEPQEKRENSSVKQRQKKAFKDPSRWKCPHPGCNRSFAVLWRLKVHYRAPVDARGSGVERGHGMELAACPKCGVEFQANRHHTNCSAGRTAGPPSKQKAVMKAPSLRAKRPYEDSDSGSQGPSPKQSATTSSAVSQQAELPSPHLPLAVTLPPPPIPQPTPSAGDSALLSLMHMLVNGMAQQPRQEPQAPAVQHMPTAENCYGQTASSIQRLLQTQGVVLNHDNLPGLPADPAPMWSAPAPAQAQTEAQALDVVSALMALKQDPAPFNPQVLAAEPAPVKQEPVQPEVPAPATNSTMRALADQWVQQQLLQLFAASVAAVDPRPMRLA